MNKQIVKHISLEKQNEYSLKFSDELASTASNRWGSVINYSELFHN